MLRKLLAVCVPLLLRGNAVGGEPELLGLHGSFEEAVVRCFGKDARVVRMYHGYLGSEWVGRLEPLFPEYFQARDKGGFLPIQGQKGSSRPVSARYEDGRVHEIVFYPHLLARNFCSHGSRIEGLSYDQEKRELRVQLSIGRAETQLEQFGRLSHTATSDVQFSLPLVPELWERIRRLDLEWRLRIVLTGTIKAIRLHHDGLWDNFVPQFDKVRCRLSDIGERVHEADGPTLEHWDAREVPCDPLAQPGRLEANEDAEAAIREDDGGEAGAAVRAARPPKSSLSSREALRWTIEAEDFEIPGADGLQPFRHGFYGREAFPDASYSGSAKNISNGRIAVCEHDDLPAKMTKRLDRLLPPGTYKLAFSTGYFRCRFRDNIFRIHLGQEVREVSYWHVLGQDGQGWCRVPAFRLGEPATEITVECLQIGSGSRSETPPYPKRFVFIDRFFLTNVMEDDVPGRLAQLRDETKEE